MRRLRRWNAVLRTATERAASLAPAMLAVVGMIVSVVTATGAGFAGENGGLVQNAPALQASAPEWPGWGGPRRNFISDSVGLASTWPEGGPKRIWARDLGGGHSSILVDGRRLYTMYRPALVTPRSNNWSDRWTEEEVVIALDATTGRTIWEHRYPASLKDLDLTGRNGVGPHSTPLIAGNRIFTTGTNKQIFALDKETGRVAWSHDLIKEFDAPVHYARMNRHPGYTCSPLAYKNLIIVTAGGPGQAVMAFRQDDGRLVWRGGDFDIGPASPVLITVQGQDQVVIFGGDRVVALHPDTGAQLWSHPHPRHGDVNVSTPVWTEDRLLFVSSGLSGGSRVVEVSSSGTKELWFSTRMRIYFGNVIRIGDHYYGSSGDFGPGIIMAVHARTGEIAWRDRSFARSSFLYADGKLIIADEDGNLGLATASPQGFKVLARAPVLKSTSWTVPTLVGTQLYLRDHYSVMALELGAS